MKNIFLLLIFTYTLIANEHSSIPRQIEQNLCKLLEQSNYSPSNTCQNGSKIVYDNHSIINENKILLFLHLQEATQHSNGYPPRKVAFMVDKKGKWTKLRGKNLIDESIESVEQDPYGGTWINSLWVIEGSTPTLYFTKDGLTLNKIVLPKSKTANGYYDNINRVCLQKNSVVLDMTIPNSNQKVLWESSYRQAITTRPNWKKRFNKNLKCLKNSKSKKWKTVQYQNYMLFVHTQTHQQIKVPINTPSSTQNSFYVQIGAFKNREYAQNIQNKLRRLKYKTSIKKRKVGVNTYLKLLIGSFNSYQQAQAVKVKLPKEFRGAFILKEENR